MDDPGPEMPFARALWAIERVQGNTRTAVRLLQTAGIEHAVCGSSAVYEWIDSHDSSGTASGVAAIAQGNDYIGVAVGSTLSEPADVWWAPVETISNSEAGFERVYQGAGFLFSWPLALAAGASRTVVVRHDVTTTRDRASEEAAVAAPAGVPATPAAR